jgi:Na+-translocating ferredoxin:NAD+ oxidoreductase RnfC subunit
MGYPIEPHRVMRTLLMTNDKKKQGSLWAQYCCECNICSLIACPESLDPKNICVDAKAILRKENLSRTQAELDVLFRDVHPARRGREIPIATLYQRLGIKQYDRYAHFVKNPINAKEVFVLLDSHIGVPANAIVQVGDQVQKGQRIGAVKGDALSSPAHASIDGEVIEVNSKGIRIKAKR